MIAFTFAQVTTGGWAAIVLAAIGVIGTVATAWATYAKADAAKASARAPVEVVQARDQAARAKDDSRRFTHQAALAERLLEEADEKLEKEQAAHERTRQERDHAERQTSIFHAQ